ncbi:MAG: hypothetical protein AABZ60_16060 [Planctomycetota bacterium]
MGLFKSKQERRIERDLEIRKGVASIKKNIKDLEKNEREYLKKARRAKAMGSKQQYDFLKNTLKRTATQRQLMDRQLLNIETALQIKNQASAHAQFAEAMNALSKSISESFGSTDFTKTQKEFEQAMAKAETMEERMEMFLDISSESLLNKEPREELISDADIEALIGAEESESSGTDEEISKGLEEIERELGKDSP